MRLERYWRSSSGNLILLGRGNHPIFPVFSVELKVITPINGRNKWEKGGSYLIGTIIDYNYSPVKPFEDWCLEPSKALRAKTPQEVCLGVVISRKIVLEN